MKKEYRKSPLRFLFFRYENGEIKCCNCDVSHTFSVDFEGEKILYRNTIDTMADGANPFDKHQMDEVGDYEIHSHEQIKKFVNRKVKINFTNILVYFDVRDYKNPSIIAIKDAIEKELNEIKS